MPDNRPPSPERSQNRWHEVVGRNASHSEVTPISIDSDNWDAFGIEELPPVKPPALPEDALEGCEFIGDYLNRQLADLIHEFPEAALGLVRIFAKLRDEINSELQAHQFSYRLLSDNMRSYALGLNAFSESKNWYREDTLPKVVRLRYRLLQMFAQLNIDYRQGKILWKVFPEVQVAPGVLLRPLTLDHAKYPLNEDDKKNLENCINTLQAKVNVNANDGRTTDTIDMRAFRNPGENLSRGAQQLVSEMIDEFVKKGSFKAQTENEKRMEEMRFEALHGDAEEALEHYDLFRHDRFQFDRFKLATQVDDHAEDLIEEGGRKKRKAALANKHLAARLVHDAAQRESDPERNSKLNASLAAIQLSRAELKSGPLTFDHKVADSALECIDKSLEAHLGNHEQKTAIKKRAEKLRMHIRSYALVVLGGFSVTAAYAGVPQVMPAVVSMLPGDQSNEYQALSSEINKENKQFNQIIELYNHAFQLIEDGHYDTAIKQLENLEKYIQKTILSVREIKNPRDQQKHRRARNMMTDIQYLKGIANFNAGKYKEALAHFNRVEQSAVMYGRQPKQRGLYRFVGWSYAKSGDLQKGRKHLITWHNAEAKRLKNSRNVDDLTKAAKHLEEAARLQAAYNKDINK